MSIKKDILFYSILDQYSINCINLIIRNNIKNKFTYICVDGKNDKIPDIITKVPSILTTNINIKIDNYVIEYIKEIINKEKKNCNNTNLIEDYMNGNDNFQFIDINDNDNMDNNGNNNKQLKTYSLLDEGFSLITNEAKEGKVNMTGIKNTNNNIDIQNIQQQLPVIQQNMNINEGPIKNINMDDLLAQRQKEILEFQK